VKSVALFVSLVVVVVMVVFIFGMVASRIICIPIHVVAVSVSGWGVVFGASVEV
jgi:hypothetical protein